MSDADLSVDILNPPTFLPSGQIKTVRQAVIDEDWLGSFQIWLYVRVPEPSLLYQQRSLAGAWAPGKLDTTAAGYYHAGESELDGLRELREELGVDLPADAVHFFGRKINVNIDSKNRERRSVSNIYFAEFNGKLEDMVLEDGEVEGIFSLPLKKLVDLFAGTLDSFSASGYQPGKIPATYTVRLESFPYNFDDYHRRMAEFFALKLGVDSSYLE